MAIDTVLKYGKGKVTDLGNVFTVSPGYDKDLSECDFSGLESDGANFTEQVLSCCDFSETNFSNCSLFPILLIFL